MINGLLDVITSHGAKGAIIPFIHIDDLKKDMTDLKNGEYHTAWLERMANHMVGDGDKFIPSDINFTAHSLISIAIPSPKVMLQFNYRGKAVHCTVPPHYTDWGVKNNQALQYLNEYLSPRGYSIVIAVTLPHKLIAVHSGLGMYGRNNICYNNKFGSYMQLMTYISDVPCNETVWHPLRRMEICEKCRACVTSCPTGAIDSNRQLINSDKCLTLINEFTEEDFPKWIDKNAHNSIVGCMKCQDCCPANANNKDAIKMGVIFTEKETTEILNHKSGEVYTDSLASKIERAGVFQNNQTNFLPRNLAALLQ